MTTCRIIVVMIVNEVLKIVNMLNEQYALDGNDKKFVLSIKNYFINYALNSPVDQKDTEFLIDCLKKRWLFISHTDNNYTLNPTGPNTKWVELAQLVSSQVNTLYLHILMPTLTNSLDLNNSSLLSETTHLDNFFLSYDHSVLYRKRAFCELIINNNYKLCIRRLLNNPQLSALHISELSFLFICNQVNAKFSIDDEAFNSFWDFLRKKVFTMLQTKGEMPLEMLVQLAFLIEKYFNLKKNNEDYTLFKEYTHRFFTQLMTCKLNDINYFYGVQLAQEKRYLLDFFIEIYKSRTYHLDSAFKTLAKWLYHYTPLLKIKAQELDEINALSSDHLIIGNSGLSFLLSLFVYNFSKGLHLERPIITLWDQETDVFSGGVELFNSLFLILKNNLAFQEQERFSTLFEEYIKPKLVFPNLLSKLIQPSFDKSWYDHVEQNNLHELGIIWFEPEFILHVLVNIAPLKSMNTQLMEGFLDELLHTYAQNMNLLEQRFRVNILFVKFCQAHDLDTVKYLQKLILLFVAERSNCKSLFILNCCSYLLKRLPELMNNNFTNPLFFFSSPSKLETKIKNGVASVSELLKYFNETLFNLKTSIKTDRYEEIWSYLTFLNTPILTVQEKKEAQEEGAVFLYNGGSNY